jgi:superfamily II DNA/RNA helicase
VPTEISDDVAEVSDKLVAASVWRGLPGRASQSFSTGLTRDDYLSLVNHASILALSDNAKDRTLAYEIITHSLRLRDQVSPALVRAVEFLLARLGNFPGRRLLRNRYKSSFDQNMSVPPVLALEAIARELENTVQGVDQPLTDFQFDFLDALEVSRAVSVSAPTSAGKSFVLSLRIREKLRSNIGACVVYLAPTRALIREVMLRLRLQLNAGGLDAVALRCVPLPSTLEDTPHGIVYVLTQERLLSLMHASEEEFRLDLLVVDEAQNIRDGARGVLLQTAIENALREAPKAEVVFACPVIANPTEFLTLFTNSEGATRKELHSPVVQNFVLVDADRDAPKQLRFSLLRRGKSISLGAREFDHKFWGVSGLRRRAQLAIEVTQERDGCLVYANGAWEAEQLAEQLASLRKSVVANEDTRDFVEFVEEHIHPEYPLVNTLKHGVGFHHGEMPGSVRAGVEDLFRGRKIQFICCTSTLLQGVNLPARHLVAEKPQKGNHLPLAQSDFLNLAGRAGRLLREFHGNVWCISPGTWVNAPTDETEQPVVSAVFDTVLNESPHLVRQVLQNETKDYDGSITATIGRLLTEFVFTGRMPSEPATPESRSELALTMDRIKGLELRLPREVFIRNSTILPSKLERIYLTLLAEPDLRPWLPLRPYDEGFYAGLVRIFELLQTEFDERAGFSFRFEANQASKWIWQRTLREIIESRLTWQRENGKRADVQKTIRDIIKCIEQRLRFHWVRHLRAYNDVLVAALIAKGQSEEADRLFPLYLHLEYGASNSVVINLVSLGFSRTASLILFKLGIFPPDADPESCRQIILRTNLTRRQVPPFLQREVRALLGKAGA